MSEDLPERLRRLPTWMLSQAAGRAHRLLADALAGSDARGHHYRLLAALQDDGPTNQVVLGHRTALDRSDVAVGIAELEQRGYVHRDPDPDDGRRKRVQITDAGTHFLADLDEVVGAVQDEVLHQLTPEQRHTLLDLLARLEPHTDARHRPDRPTTTGEAVRPVGR